MQIEEFRLGMRVQNCGQTGLHAAGITDWAAWNGKTERETQTGKHSARPADCQMKPSRFRLPLRARMLQVSWLTDCAIRKAGFTIVIDFNLSRSRCRWAHRFATWRCNAVRGTDWRSRASAVDKPWGWKSRPRKRALRVNPSTCPYSRARWMPSSCNWRRKVERLMRLLGFEGSKNPRTPGEALKS